MQCAAALPLPHHKISYTQDDGNVVPEPLGLKIPEAVQKLAEDYVAMRKALLDLCDCKESELEVLEGSLRMMLKAISDQSKTSFLLSMLSRFLSRRGPAMFSRRSFLRALTACVCLDWWQDRTQVPSTTQGSSWLLKQEHG